MTYCDEGYLACSKCGDYRESEYTCRGGGKSVWRSCGQDDCFRCNSMEAYFSVPEAERGLPREL